MLMKSRWAKKQQARLVEVQVPKEVELLKFRNFLKWYVDSLLINSVQYDEKHGSWILQRYLLQEGCYKYKQLFYGEWMININETVTMSTRMATSTTMSSLLHLLIMCTTHGSMSSGWHG